MLDALETMDRIPGWLRVPAAAFTYYLIAGSSTTGSPIVEIGVYRGKYLSVLRAASSANTQIVGYDIYPHNQEQAILRDFRNAFGDTENIHLIKADSTTLTPERVLQDCGARPRFISVDGSHEAGPVESDLRLATAVLAPGGIVAADDFLNPFAIGVNEAFYRYQFETSSAEPLVPFAFVTNKLFLTHREAAAQHLERTRFFVRENINAPYMAGVRERLNKGATLERSLLGWPMVVITM